MKCLTNKQAEVFDFIVEYITDNHFPPTYREIGVEFGITVRGAFDHLKAIEKKGYIKTYKNESRAITLLKHKVSVEEK